MPVIDDLDYRPGWLFRNGHISTAYAALLRRTRFKFEFRERLDTDDGDFLDVDHKFQGSRKLAILCHGLEGSSSSNYILGMGATLFNAGYDIVAWNHRSCSGEMNRLKRFYHHAVTDDLHFVVSSYADRYDQVVLVGFSLGANLVLNYLGRQEFDLSNRIKAGLCFSAPVDLPSCVVEIHKPHNKIYHDRFLKSIKQKIAQKQSYMPGLDLKPLKEIKSLRALDNAYTAPLHNFEDGMDYYLKSCSKPYLGNIEIPTLLVNAQNDSFLGDACYPREEAGQNPSLHLCMPKYGGHCAFVSFGRDIYWSESIGLQFLETHL